jgi:hypothetical protein
MDHRDPGALHPSAVRAGERVVEKRRGFAREPSVFERIEPQEQGFAYVAVIDSYGVNVPYNDQCVTPPK